MINFNSFKCYFCQSELTSKYIETKVVVHCDNDNCSVGGYTRQGLFRHIEYIIGGVKFNYMFKQDGSQDGMTTESYSGELRLDAHLIATPDNYLQVIDRLQKLQSFK